MTKIANRFKKDNVITVHDELLTALIGLDPNYIYHEEINGEIYLINSIKGKNFEIGLRLKLSDCDEDEIILDFDETDGVIDERYIRKRIERNYKRLCFTNLEKYMLNVLFDKYLNNHQEFDMTFLEIESYYRGKAKPRATTVSLAAAKKYASALDSLSKKELFLITTPSFRKDKRHDYGVSNQHIYQPLLEIKKAGLLSKNNVIFSYSLGGFGRTIKLSRRYSTILPLLAYKVGFNQLRYHMTAFYLAQEVFIQEGLIKKDPLNERNREFDIDIESYIYATKETTLENKPDTNPLRIKRKFANDIQFWLKLIDGVYDVEVTYDYNETERFMQKHEYDYDIETDLDNYQFTLNDLDQDTDIKITVVMHPL